MSVRCQKSLIFLPVPALTRLANWIMPHLESWTEPCSVFTEPLDIPMFSPAPPWHFADQSLCGLDSGIPARRTMCVVTSAGRPRFGGSGSFLRMTPGAYGPSRRVLRGLRNFSTASTASIAGEISRPTWWVVTITAPTGFLTHVLIDASRHISRRCVSAPKVAWYTLMRRNVTKYPNSRIKAQAHTS